MECLVSSLLILLGAALLRYSRLGRLTKLALLHGSSEQVRTLGRTRFADSGAYHEVRLSEQNRLEYFRDGFTVLRNALPKELLRDLRSTMLEEFGHWNTAWSHQRAFDSDALLDFYVYGSLGSIAAQLFQSPGTETEAEEPTAFLWREFMYFRHPGRGLADFHIDSEDCDKEALPPNFTRANRPRIWVPLDDRMHVPTFTNFSLLMGQMRDDEVRAKFWRGELEAVYENLDPVFAEKEEWHTVFLPHRKVRLGDVVLHVPCLMHSSPAAVYPFTVATLFPTFAIGSSKAWQAEQSIRTCESASGGAPTVDRDPSCYVQAWPPQARPAPGSTRVFRHRGSLWEWLSCSLRGDGTRSVSPKTCHLPDEEEELG